MKEWGFSKSNYDNWPVDENGEKVAPAFLEHLGYPPMDAEVEVSVLRAYNIPVLFKYPNDGEFGKLILGFPGSGVDIFVPETMLEDARNILSGTICEVDE